MATTIRTDLDDKAVAEGFKRIATAAKSTGKDVVDVNTKIDKSARQSAEGLGFISSALGRISPQLSLVGEATVKQLPTLTKYGDQLKQWGMAAGTVGATAGALASIGDELGKINQESIAAGSAGDKMMNWIESFSRWVERVDRRQLGKNAPTNGGWIGNIKRWAEQENKGQEDQRVQDPMAARKKLAGAISGSAQTESERQLNQSIIETQVENLKSIHDLNRARDEEIAKLAEIGRAEVFNAEAAAVSIAKRLAFEKKALDMGKQKAEFEKGSTLKEQSVIDSVRVEKAESLKEIEDEILYVKQTVAMLDKGSILYGENRNRLQQIDANLQDKKAEFAKNQRDYDKEIVAMNASRRFTLQLDNLRSVAAIDQAIVKAERELAELQKDKNRNLDAIKQKQGEINQLKSKETSEMQAQRALGEQIARQHIADAIQKTKDKQKERADLVAEAMGNRGGPGSGGIVQANGGDGADAMQGMGNQRLSQRDRHRIEVALHQAIRAKVQEADLIFTRQMDELERDEDTPEAEKMQIAKRLRRERAGAVRAAKNDQGQNRADEVIDAQRQVRDGLDAGNAAVLKLNSEQIALNQEVIKGQDDFEDRIRRLEDITRVQRQNVAARNQRAGQR